MNPISFLFILVTLMLASAAIIAVAAVVALVKVISAMRDHQAQLLDRLMAVTTPAAHTTDQAARREMLRVIQAPQSTETTYAPERFRNGTAEPSNLATEEPGSQVGNYQTVN
jgi:hypothetical protein